MTFNEIRATSATGGQKGQKPVRYDLLPHEFFSAFEGLCEMTRGVRSAVDAFWRGVTDPGILFRARDECVRALGGSTAALYVMAKIYGQGALKYEDNNWKRGYPWSWSYAALLRHLHAIERGEWADPESGEPHWGHVLWHLCTLWWFATYGVGVDDRPSLTTLPGSPSDNLQAISCGTCNCEDCMARAGIFDRAIEPAEDAPATGAGVPAETEAEAAEELERVLRNRPRAQDTWIGRKDPNTKAMMLKPGILSSTWKMPELPPEDFTKRREDVK